MSSRNHPRIAVVGLGYVGLPVAVAFAEAYPGTVGFDVDASKVAALRAGRDPNGEVDTARLAASGLSITDEPVLLRVVWNPTVRVVDCCLEVDCAEEVISERCGAYGVGAADAVERGASGADRSPRGREREHAEPLA